MEYINKNAYTGLFNGEHNLYSWDEIAEFMESVPAADVVPVVRCKDCKFYYSYPDEYRTCHEYHEIDGTSKIMAAKDFCSHGQRRELTHEVITNGETCHVCGGPMEEGRLFMCKACSEKEKASFESEHS